MSRDRLHPSGTRVRAVLACLAVVAAILGCNMQRGTAPDLPGTITAQALTLEARGATAAAPSESPAAAAETSTLTEAPAPTAALAAATSPPQPTKTPKPTKTTAPVLAAIPAGPLAPEINLIEMWACTPTTFNSGPGWIAELRIYWTDNSSDEEYFLLYSSTPLHPEKALVTAPPPNTTRITIHRSYLQSSIADEPYDTFYIAAYNASGTSLSPYSYWVDRCTKAY